MKTPTVLRPRYVLFLLSSVFSLFLTGFPHFAYANASLSLSDPDPGHKQSPASIRALQHDFWTGFITQSPKTFFEPEVQAKHFALLNIKVASDPQRLANAYYIASKIIKSHEDYFLSRYLHEFLKANATHPAPNLEPETISFQLSILNSALQHGFEDSLSDYLKLHQWLKIPPNITTLQTHFSKASTQERKDICQNTKSLSFSNVSQQLKLKEWFDTNCYLEDPEDAKWLFSGQDGYTSSATSKLKRAIRLHFVNAYTASLDLLNALPDTSLESNQLCQKYYWQARSTYRLRRRDDAMTIYKKVVSSCPTQENERVKSLYSLGERAFDTGKFTESRKYFEQLLNDYPHRSHADDALMFLARIARNLNDLPDEQYVQQALEQYPQGDMLFEILWEHLEPLYIRKNFTSFLKQAARWSPKREDPHYYSQGRIEYFVAQAFEALNQLPKAIPFYKKIVQIYPFSFYGYLSLLKLKTLDPDTLKSLFNLEKTPPSWFNQKFQKSFLFSLIQAGLYKDAARLAPLELDLKKTPDQWQYAYLLSLADRYAESHNIIRHKIEHRPWHRDTLLPSTHQDPTTLNLLQVTLAWPLPFPHLYNPFTKDENAQHDPIAQKQLSNALSVAISREESGFIPSVVSYAGAVGLMQLMPRTALAHDKDVLGAATPDKLKQPEINIRVGIDHLYWLSNRFNGQPILMIGAYNAGAGAMRKWVKRTQTHDIALFVENIPYDQTRNYTKRVYGSYLAYQWMWHLFSHQPYDTIYDQLDERLPSL